MPHSSTDRRQSKAGGFTLIELMVVLVVSAVMMGLLFGPLDDLYQSNTRGVRSTVQTGDTKGSLRTVLSTVSISHSFNNTNTLPDAYGPAWNWYDYEGNDVLITTNYATSKEMTATGAEDRQLILGSDCATPLLNNYVYFVKKNGGTSGTLYRRLIKNPESTCGTPVWYQNSTCGTGCAYPDAKLLSNVTEFSVAYFNDPGSPTPTNAGASASNASSDSTVPANAKAVGITVKTKTGNGKNAVEASSTIRIQKINGN